MNKQIAQENKLHNKQNRKP